MATAKTPPTAQAATKPATQLYTVLGNLEHDGEPYAPGSPVELTDDQAKPLLDLQVVTPATAAA